MLLVVCATCTAPPDLQAALRRGSLELHGTLGLMAAGNDTKWHRQDMRLVPARFVQPLALDDKTLHTLRLKVAKLVTAACNLEVMHIRFCRCHS